MKYTILPYKKPSMFAMGFITFSILVSIDFWSNIFIMQMHILNVFIYVIAIICLYVFINKCKTKESLDTIVLWTIVTIFLSIIPATIDYDQNVIDTIKACVLLSYPLFFYFYLRSLNVEGSLLTKIVTGICVIWVFLELFQQLTYPPNLWFSGRYLTNDKFDIEQRLGLWRFYIWGVDFVMIAFSYWLYSIKDKSISISFVVKLLLAIIFTIGLLCYGSRKHIYVTILILGLFGFKGKSFNKYFIMLFVAYFLYVLYKYFYANFAELNEMANKSQGEGEDFIRLIAAKYFLFDFSSSPLYPIFGCGLDFGESKLGHEIHRLADFYGIYQADVGIIGYYSKFGLLGVSAIVMYIVYFIKNWRYIDDWLKSFFIMKNVLIIFDFWAIWDVGMMAYAIFLYILGINIKKNKMQELKVI